VFYEEFFTRLDEEVFSVLYSEKKSRPNTPVNILVGFETLKSGFGRSGAATPSACRKRQGGDEYARLGRRFFAYGLFAGESK